MELTSQQEVENTRRKIRLLEEGYREVLAESGGDESLRRIELQSLMRMINQMKEEIIRYQAHVGQVTEPVRSMH